MSQTINALLLARIRELACSAVGHLANGEPEKAADAISAIDIECAVALQENALERSRSNGLVFDLGRPPPPRRADTILVNRFGPV